MTTTDSPARRAVLVTGAGRGIGRASALAFARAGFDVALNYSRSESAARTCTIKESLCESGAEPDFRRMVDVEFDRQVRSLHQPAFKEALERARARRRTGPRTT